MVHSYNIYHDNYLFHLSFYNYLNITFKLISGVKMLNSVDFIKESINQIKDKVQDEKAIIALSGGVDSSVCSVLVKKAIGDNLIAIFVDHGLLREGEGEEVSNIFKNRLNFKYIDAHDEFLEALSNVEDPEEKRKIIGKKFIEVFEKEAKKVQAKFLVQGTIAPDWIESEGKIKSHHNLALPGGMVLDLIEPVRELYKDEVREIGKELGLPDKLVNRQPFPGPGLAVRIIGSLTEEKLAICRKANNIVSEEIEKNSLDEELWQYFAVLTNTKVTGVKGDQRDFGYLVVLRMVTSIDAMTATVPELPWTIIRTISKRITSEISEVTHVTLSVSDKPPSTIEFA
jgi:GMP synthase (glutamine-hydrolysing)